MKHKSLYKTLTYRATSIIITIAVLRWFMDEWYVIGKITVISQALKAIWYYGHEKIYKAIKRKRLIGKVTDEVVEYKLRSYPIFRRKK